MILTAITCAIFCTVHAGTHSQFLLLNQDGGYNYGYDTPQGPISQAADSSNQVSGQYYYKNNLGQNVLLKYRAGVEGFVPEVVTIEPEPKSNQYEQNSISVRDTDGSYAFYYKTDNSLRQESADAGNNVQGKYSYTNAAGSHDLQYVAGAQTGFLVTGGSLANSIGLSKESNNLEQSKDVQTESNESVVTEGTLAQSNTVEYSDSEEVATNVRQSFHANQQHFGYLFVPIANLYFPPNTEQENVKETLNNFTTIIVPETVDTTEKTEYESTTNTSSTETITEEVSITDGASFNSTTNVKETSQEADVLQENVETIDVHNVAADEKSSVIQKIISEAPSPYTIDGNVVVYSYLPVDGNSRQFGYYFETL